MDRSITVITNQPPAIINLIFDFVHHPVRQKLAGNQLSSFSTAWEHQFSYCRRDCRGAKVQIVKKKNSPRQIDPFRSSTEKLLIIRKNEWEKSEINKQKNSCTKAVEKEEKIKNTNKKLIEEYKRKSVAVEIRRRTLISVKKTKKLILSRNHADVEGESL